MKAFLVNAPADFGRMAKGNAAPLGLAYLGAYLKKHGIRVAALDVDAVPIASELLIERIAAEAPDVVAIGCSSHTRFSAFQIARQLKSYLPGAHVTIGGHHASATFKDTLGHVPVDSVVVGEGEETMLELCRAIETRNDVDAIPGLATRGNGIFDQRDRIRDLEAIPFPDRDLFQASSYQLRLPPRPDVEARNVEYVITSRGCPFRCAFCSTSATWGRRVRFRSAVSVAEEIEHLVRVRGCDGLFIYDDHFILSFRRLCQIAGELSRRDIRIPILCYGRVDSVNEDKLRVLHGMGVRYISFGMESGSQRVLDALDKDITVEQIEDAVEMCADVGITAKGTFMVGSPTEEFDDFLETAGLIRRLQRVQPSFVPNIAFGGVFIYPGCALEDQARERGILPADFSWSEPDNRVRSSLNVPIYSNEDTEDLLRRAERWWRRQGRLRLLGQPKALATVAARRAGVRR